MRFRERTVVASEIAIVEAAVESIIAVCAAGARRAAGVVEAIVSELNAAKVAKAVALRELAAVRGGCSCCCCRRSHVMAILTCKADRT